MEKEVINEIIQEVFLDLKDTEFPYWSDSPNSQPTGWFKVEIVPKHNGIRINTVDTTQQGANYSYMSSINEFQEHVEQKKLHTKQYILCGTISMKFRNR